MLADGRKMANDSRQMLIEKDPFQRRDSGGLLYLPGTAQCRSRAAPREKKKPRVSEQKVGTEIDGLYPWTAV